MEAERRFDPEASNVTAARHWASGQLRAWDLEDLVQPVEVIVSELVQNAFVHARTECQLRLAVVGPCLQVEVRDWNPAAPQTLGTADIGGWGLQLINSLADRWGVHLGGVDKTVWAHLAVPGPARR